jgi:uncharacterized membrane protein YuzA (DUF378 family)
MNAIYSFTFFVTCLGAVLWGLVGIGGFIGKNLNAISFISRGNSVFEYSLYTIVGVSAVVYIWLSSRK